MSRRKPAHLVVLQHLAAWVAVAFALFPIVWVFSAALNPANTLVGQRLIPANWSWVNFEYVFTSPQHPFMVWMRNSMLIAAATAVGAMLLSALAAYSLSRFDFPGRRQTLLAVLLVQIFTQMLAVVAIYLLLLNVREAVPFLGINTHGGLILIYLGGSLGFQTWLMKGYFDSIPRSLDESALIDGATQFGAFWHVILPLARPILAVVAMLVFIAIYSEFILASVLLTGLETLTLPVGLQRFIDEQYAARWGIFSAAAIVGAIPVVAVFMYVQRYLVSGLTTGGVKG